MRIVHQSAADSYSWFPFLVSPQYWLPAPAIAGYLPPPTQSADPAEYEAEAFTYHNPAFADLSEARREALFAAVRTLLDVAIEFQKGTINDHAVLTALMLYRQAIAHEPVKARNPAEFNALMDTPLLQYMIDSARRHAVIDAAIDAEFGGDHD